jgi:hypothetical protein
VSQHGGWIYFENAVTDQRRFHWHGGAWAPTDTVRVGLAHDEGARASCPRIVVNFAHAGFAFIVPAGTPKEIISLLHREIIGIMALSDVKKRMSALGFEPVGGTPGD